MDPALVVTHSSLPSEEKSPSVNSDSLGCCGLDVVAEIFPPRPLATNHAPHFKIKCASPTLQGQLSVQTVRRPHLKVCEVLPSSSSRYDQTEKILSPKNAHLQMRCTINCEISKSGTDWANKSSATGNTYACLVG